MAYRPKWWDKASGKLSVLELAAALHESISGVTDPLETDERNRIIRCLEWVVKEWRPNKSGNEQHRRYDLAVRLVVQSTLAEAGRLSKGSCKNCGGTGFVSDERQLFKCLDCDGNG